MKALRFRIQNFRNIDDSGWIDLDQVTVFVGRNESGKTSLLKALHKFNPATPEPYDAQREFPRDRYTSDYLPHHRKWTVCSIEFEIAEDIKEKITEFLDDGMYSPKRVTVTRYYDQSFDLAYEPPLDRPTISPSSLLNELKNFASGTRRLASADDDTRSILDEWATRWHDRLKGTDDLRTCDSDLTQLRNEVNNQKPHATELFDVLLVTLDPLIEEMRRPSPQEQADAIIKEAMPVLIYFENYGVLDSAVWLSQFLPESASRPNDSRIRTTNAMFRLANLDPKSLHALDREDARSIEERARGIEERSIQLNSASNDISKKFSEWWNQRRHTIRYGIDGDYFRMWVADNTRPGVDIELESRSKGFQWFFSFYLVFSAESDDGHKDAILLLDEPGLHLHPTAQQELIAFFEKISGDNQIAYTTHSPFLIDAKNLHRVRAVTEDETGHSSITAGTWPADRATIFPLQAAAGYAMISGLLAHHNNVLVEGWSDFIYLQALARQCANTDRVTLHRDDNVVPCGGVKNIPLIAALFGAEDVHPVVLLDGDEAGRARHDALAKALYVDRESNIIMLDDILDRSGQDVTIEDMLGEEVILAVLKDIGFPLRIEAADEPDGSLPKRIEAAAKRQSVELPQGWKYSVASQLARTWTETGTLLSDEVLDRAEALFQAIRKRFGD